MWWDDEPQEIHIDRQHTVNFEANSYVEKIRDLKIMEEEDPNIKEALLLLESTKAASDLGCGGGFSAEALTIICPSLKHIDLVDAKPVILERKINEIRDKEIEVRTFQESIQDFLKNADNNSRDLLFFGRVLNNNLNDADIERMYQILEKDGLVFEVGDTCLDRHDMSEYFVVLYEHSFGFHSRDVIWKKKEAKDY